LWRSNSDDDSQARMNYTRKEIQTRRRRKIVGEDKTQRRNPRMWCGKKMRERERERWVWRLLEAYMQWVEFGRNWRDPAPAAGIVVKIVVSEALSISCTVKLIN